MRPRFTSLSLRANIVFLKPRLGRRRCNGIWPPSKPLMRTPERAVWPLPPRPEVFPLPEPMPRPTRMRFLREPVLSAISLSFIVRSPCLSLLADNADEVLNLLDHATHRRRIRQFGGAADPIELQSDQRRALRMVAADRATRLLDLDRPCGLGHHLKNSDKERAVS